MSAARRWVPPRGRVLVLAPHPDDEALGCGAVLALHARRGDPALIVFMTDGEAGRPRRPGLGARRRAEAVRAARLLGAAAEHWGLPDGGLRRAPGLRGRVAALAARWKPRILYAPSLEDPHPDHRAAARAAAGFEGLLCRYEVTRGQRPTHLFRADGLFAKKRAALRAHASQEAVHRWSEKAERLARLRALFLPGARYAEGFRISAPNPTRRAV